MSEDKLARRPGSWTRARRSLISLAAIAILSASPTSSLAGGKIGLYGVRMVPQNQDASRFSKAAWGAGLQAVLPVRQLGNHFAGVAGLEVVNLLSNTDTRLDADGFRVEQSTSQDYFRFYLGGQIGPHGPGFIRPHAGVNLAIVNYGIHSSLERPNDQDPEMSLVQDLGGEGHTVSGLDVTLGVDLNIANTVSLDGGVRYLKSFGVPQQLGDGSIKIHPDYFQVYMGVGVSFGFLKRMGGPKLDVTRLGTEVFPPRTPPESIRLFVETPDTAFTQIALVTFEGGVFGDSKSKAMTELRGKAWELGGDAIILKKLEKEEHLSSIDPKTGQASMISKTVAQALIIRFLE